MVSASVVDALQFSELRSQLRVPVACLLVLGGLHNALSRRWASLAGASGCAVEVLE